MFRLLVFVLPAGQVVQGSGNVGEPLSKKPVVTNKSNKRLDFSITIWRRTSGNGFQILFRGEYPFFAHMMSQIVNLCLEHLTLRWFQLETMFSKSVKDDTHSFQVFFLSLRENDYIIQVDEAIGEIQFTKAV